jgi:drug/metabolite transporter (DMT)-like permease
VILPFVLLTQPIGVFALDIKHLLILLVVGFLHTGLAYCMYFSSIKDVSGQEVAILSYIDPLVAVVLSVTLLNEPLNVWQIVGGVMILGFTLLNEIDFKKVK